MTPLRTGALLLFILPSILRAEWRTGLQAYLASGIENGEHYYIGGGVEGFCESEKVFYIPGCSFVRIIDTHDVTLVADGTPPGPPAGFPLPAESRYSKLAFQWATVWTSSSPRAGAGVTMNGSAEPWTVRVVDASPEAGSPPFPSHTGRILSEISGTRWTVVAGGEISRDGDGMRVGVGALRITDFEETRVTQVYGFASSNQQRTVYALLRREESLQNSFSLTRRRCSMWN